ncbi:MAG TPA: hypothetical protein VJU61_20695 [Polyangiaceae bacterium]|nr:hypothetical protein [Polyangiaceae bacterium]
MLNRRFGMLSLSAALLMLSGCGDEPEPVASSVGGAGSTPDGGGSVAGSGSCTTGLSDACTCSDGKAGTKTCSSGYWTSCSCGSSPSVVTVGACKAGHYEGSFEGIYRSGFILGAPLPVYALDISLGPALKFTLEEKVGGDPEFPSYVISDGVIQGTADFVFPFNAKLTGTLDCRTKTLTGEMDGGYSIVLPVGINEGKFIGPVTGDYDSSNHTFTVGTWTLHEEDSLGISFLGDTGGEGKWTAKWVSPP